LLLTDYSHRFKRVLKKAGLGDSAIEAAWPSWWTEEAADSASAKAELRFSIARKLGLDPRSLLEDAEEPTFIWKDEAHFKNLTAESPRERAAITSFGMSVAGILVEAAPAYERIEGLQAKDLRAAILNQYQYVRLADLLSLCWQLGLPVVYQRVFPLRAKRAYAMSVRIRNRFAILLGKEAGYPALAAFYLAHELGHIATKHLSTQTALVDLTIQALTSSSDLQETEANRFALELLTGSPSIAVTSKAKRPGPQQLAQTALAASKDLGIEPGTLALCYGYNEDMWETAVGALKYIYKPAGPLWRNVNQFARSKLDLTRIPTDSASFIEAILGG
jgi:Zn-dependent peptidase ImmA (M78 family)